MSQEYKDLFNIFSTAGALVDVTGVTDIEVSSTFVFSVNRSPTRSELQKGRGRMPGRGKRLFRESSVIIYSAAAIF